MLRLFNCFNGFFRNHDVLEDYANNLDVRELPLDECFEVRVTEDVGTLQGSARKSAISTKKQQQEKATQTQTMELTSGLPESATKITSFHAHRGIDGHWYYVTPADLEEIELKAAFRKLDLDGDGYISMQDLRQSHKLANNIYCNKHLKHLLSAADAANEPTIGYSKYCVMMKPPAKLAHGQDQDLKEVRELFYLFDHNRNRYLTTHDVKLIAEYLGFQKSEALEQMLDEAEAAGGKISWCDLVGLIKRYKLKNIVKP